MDMTIWLETYPKGVFLRKDIFGIWPGEMHVALFNTFQWMRCKTLGSILNYAVFGKGDKISPLEAACGFGAVGNMRMDARVSGCIRSTSLVPKEYFRASAVSASASIHAIFRASLAYSMTQTLGKTPVAK